KNSLQGKKILLRFDGGMGDTLQFIRYAQLIKNLGATVFAQVQKPLIPLLSRCPYIDTMYAHDDQLPLAHDWAALMSLPAIFNSDEQTIPRNIPYLYPDELLIKHWHDYLTTDTNIKIGICWQADVFNDSSRPLVARRGIPLHEFYQLADHTQIHFYSLQQKEGLEQLTNLPDSFNLQLFDESFDIDHGSFMDTAAVIKNLDLVITVDTAIAHLAGALGTPVWLLLPYATDWRWIVGRTDSPWYPSMKIFKQSIAFDWKSVMNKINQELAIFINERN
ncbi:MAG: glycosyltransferase family 9 protein, partial [Candidatus Babeliales bacterium]|nr:glycosyltransferase family 9 protein [Candidatus Babeliales bacterium]